MLSNKEENMAMSPFDNKNCSLKEYRLFLDKILSKNEIIKYYDQPSLMKATEYQWQRKIIHTKNIFRLIKAFFCVKKQKSTIVKCVLRHFGFFKRMDNIIDGAR